VSQLSLRLYQLAHALDRRLVPKVPPDGIKEGTTEKEKDEVEKQRRSRALTALAAVMLAGIPDEKAAKWVTDRMNDDGIDGFAKVESHVGPPVLYLVQAKWSAKGNYNFGTDEVRTLVDGFRKVRTWNGLHPQNPIQAFKSEIWPVVITPGAKFVLAWVTSGANRPSDGVKKYAVQQAAGAAGGQAPVETRFLVLEDFTKELLRDVTPAGVEVTGEFIHSRGVDAQTQSLQGAISANVLGEWYRYHPKGLLDDNVRVALSHDSGVNAEIVRTLLEDPRNFWFFHKGVTALCETWEFSGANARVAPVTFRGLRIVDGAQTVSSIAAALEMAEQKGAAAVADMARAEVPVRFIKLEGREPGFGARITFTNNRANPITARDMLAMHDVQQRIRDDFALAFDWAYLIRADEDAPEEQDKCSVLEAVIAMASARLTVHALVEAGADIEAIWPGARDLYGQLFSARTSTAEVWRRVRALRIIRAELQKTGACTTEREKEVAVLGDLLIAHIVFRRLGNDGIDDIASGWDSQLANVPGHVHAALQDLTASVEDRLAKKGAPAPGKGFKRVASLLQDDKWLAMEVERILAPGGSASPGGTVPPATWPSEPEFRLPIKGGREARGRRCDGGFLVSVGSLAGLEDWPSLQTPQLRHRRNLRGSLGLVPFGGYLRLTRDALFESPSRAAGVMIGHPANGPHQWTSLDGRSYNVIFPSIDL
jgi:AIPR protein/Domain of unknown function (DUF4357)